MSLMKWKMIAAILSLSLSLLAQPNDSLASHIIWERHFDEPKVRALDSAAVDPQGNLWIAVSKGGNARILRLDPDGNLSDFGELPEFVRPVPPAELAYFHIAISPSGQIGLLGDYSHGGKIIYFDGAKFGMLSRDGKLDSFTQIAEPGQWYQGLVALSDEHFLVLGDQEPLVILRVDAGGTVSWRRSFNSKWVFNSGAALENGASCIVSPGSAAAVLHLMRLDSSGVVRHETRIPARRADAVAGPNGVCAVLYDREPQLKRGEFFLTALDSSFHRLWTTPVIFDAPQGNSFQLLVVKDGYVVSAGERTGSFLAKYNFSGRLLWSTVDTERRWAKHAGAFGDSFYLVGAGPKSDLGLTIIRAH